MTEKILAFLMAHYDQINLAGLVVLAVMTQLTVSVDVEFEPLLIAFRP